jgi:hypothetical protein
MIEQQASQPADPADDEQGAETLDTTPEPQTLAIVEELVEVSNPVTADDVLDPPLIEPVGEEGPVSPAIAPAEETVEPLLWEPTKLAAEPQRIPPAMAENEPSHQPIAPPDTSAQPQGRNLDPEVRRRAQQGDLQALTQLLSDSLQAQAVQVTEVTIQQDCLQISLASPEVPVPNVVMPIIHAALGELALREIQSLEVYGYEQDQGLPVWRERLASIASLGSASRAPSPLGDSQPSPPSSQTLAAALLEQYAAGERDFTHLNCCEINLEGATLTLANFEGVELMWANLSHAGLYHTNLSRTNLQYANLSDAVLQSAQLSGANLQNANLQRAKLNGAVLRGANLLGADLTGADLKNAILEQATLPDGTILD